MEIGNDSLNLTPAEATRIWSDLTSSNDEVTQLKYRFQTALMLWSVGKVNLSAEKMMDLPSGLVIGIATGKWKESDGEPIHIETTQHDLDLIREHVVTSLEADYGDAMGTPYSKLERAIYEAAYPDDFEQEMTEHDRNKFESDEFTYKLEKIAMGRYIINQIDKHRK